MGIRYQAREGLTKAQRAKGTKIVRSAMMFKLSEKGFFDLMSAMNPSLKRSDVVAVVDALQEVVLSQCTQGVGVRIPGLADIVPGVRGTQDAKGNWLKGPIKELRMKPVRPLVKKFEARAHVELAETTSIVPVIMSVCDARSERTNCMLSRGGSVTIRGRYLKYHKDAEDEGVFVRLADGSEVKAKGHSDNTDKRLMAEIPKKLPKGAKCELIVRMRLYRNNALRSSASELVFELV